METTAPWNLEGKGYIILFKFSHNYIYKEGYVPDYLRDKFVGGIGSVMLVDYHSSNVGPYKEILFIPGKFDYCSKRLAHISKIYVSSQDSVEQGKNNWGIPKEFADIKWITSGKQEIIKAYSNGVLFFEATLSHGKLKFPMNTKWLPFPLVQQMNGKEYFTQFEGKGRASLGKIEKTNINQKYFPNIELAKPFAVFKIEPFNIVFKEAKVIELKD